MVKGFSKQEKQIIYSKLILEGKKLFSVFGLKKTSISQLTKAVGIAQGTFYQFFTSKEELFFDILEEEEKEIKQKLLDKIGEEPMTRKAFKDMLLFGISMIDQHPIIKSLFQEESMEHLLRKLPPERIQQHLEKDEFVLSPLLVKWQKSNVLVNKDSAIITGAIRGFFMMLLHKQEIGEEVYPDVVDLLAECLSAGLVREGNDR
ncbi:TetR family transcriptional regulator [Niallia circulans]|jgi:AcrR family transcriptional regulator|uniref:TetR family transcriptional regulator n=1 Tax=Niallia circulans TaxID=1397 RepID=A0AA91YZE8_NIACI|nr:TetR/AcrR family transcriptional regulator [Niallia circulans]PAD81563.1 TetR family transcriptional regulator [Niallia circulans]